jgi:hypothetical protein
MCGESRKTLICQGKKEYGEEEWDRVRCRCGDLVTIRLGNPERWRIDIGSGQEIYVGVRRMEMGVLCYRKELLMSTAWYLQTGRRIREEESDSGE